MGQIYRKILIKLPIMCLLFKSYELGYWNSNIDCGDRDEGKCSK